MSSKSIRQIKLPTGFDAARIESVLAESFLFREEDPLQRRLTFYDTFDWRLFNKFLTLHADGRTLFLRRLPGGEILHSTTSDSPAVFARDLPESMLKEVVKPLLEPRALLELAAVSLQSRTYRILNKNDKTVARLVFTQVSPFDDEGGQSPPDSSLELRPVRGYVRHAREIAGRIAELGVPVILWKEIYTRAMRASGRVPGGYSSKLDLQLEPYMRADDATRLILRRLLQVMRANEDGIRADIDVEFLHDYRVAVRRTRSALSQIKNVFPSEPVARFRQDFAALGEVSNELRDLDVYLLSEGTYRTMLPDVLQEDIAPLFGYLRSRRPGALGRVVERLDSQAYEHMMSDWGAFLDTPSFDASPPANAGLPVIDLARKRIYKHYRRVIKDGEQLLERPSKELMHALRIECKKLRYLIEFFASLFPPDQIDELVTQLKSLQDNLGEFNDLTIQELYLLELSDEFPLDQPGARRTLAAIGALVEGLSRRQQVVQGDFARIFDGFASSKNKKRYRRLFAGKLRGTPDDDHSAVQQ